MHLRKWTKKSNTALDGAPRGRPCSRLSSEEDRALDQHLLRRLDDCRRRIAKLEEIYIREPIFTGWMRWEGGRPANADEREVTWHLTKQHCFFYLTGDFETGNN